MFYRCHFCVIAVIFDAGIAIVSSYFSLLVFFRLFFVSLSVFVHVERRQERRVGSEQKAGNGAATSPLPDEKCAFGTVCPLRYLFES